MELNDQIMTYGFTQANSVVILSLGFQHAGESVQQQGALEGLRAL